MIPIEFPEQNTVWGANQAPYLPLPAFVDDERTISSWRLSWRERVTVLITGRLWLH